MARSHLRKVGMVLAFVLALTLAASAQTNSTMVNFNNNNGQSPWANMIQGTDGNFYGTTYTGGQFNQGTVFKMTPWGTFTVLWSFTNETDGANPIGPLVQASDGNFYGTTYQGGSHQYGAVFMITPSGRLLVLHGFSAAEGGNPMGGLIQGADGVLYGTTSGGMPETLGSPAHRLLKSQLKSQPKPLDYAGNDGTVFSLTTDGKIFNTLHYFCQSGSPCDGSTPTAGLVQDSNGVLYGTTYWGGTNDDGTVFSITTDGTTFNVLHNFSGNDGYDPYAPLVFGHDGNLYGTTEYGGGRGGEGVIFNVSTDGQSFNQIFTFRGSNGAYPEGALVLGFDGYFYGTTWGGGNNYDGAIYRINPETNHFKLLYSFGGPDGTYLASGMVQAVNGSFYGTASVGGSLNMGTVYSLSTVPEEFVAMNPCRLLDTRTTGAPLVGGTPQNFDLRSLAIANNCGSLDHSKSYALNVTLVPRFGPVGYVTLWPAGSTMPVVSTMNAYEAQVKANAAIVPGGVDGQISVYSSDTTDVILDLNGYFTERGWNNLQFYTMTSCRVVDTRGSTGVLGGPYLSGNVPRQFPMMTSACFAGLNPPSAYSLNVTAVPHQPSQPLAYLTIWPSNTDMPNVSTLNNPLGTITANAAIVAPGAGADGPITVYAYNDTDLIIDVNGYFAPTNTGGLDFFPGMPCRSMDTRNGAGSFAGATSTNTMQTVCTPMQLPGAYVYNATVVPQGQLGYLTLWPDTTDQPVVSTLNSMNGAVTSNLAIVPTITGTTDAYADGYTNLIMDVTGYFAPPPTTNGGGGGGD